MWLDVDNYQRLMFGKADELKRYKEMSPQLRRALEGFGFKITDDGKHCKLLYRGNPRYHTTLSKTANDHQEGQNAADIIKDMLYEHRKIDVMKYL